MFFCKFKNAICNSLIDGAKNFLECAKDQYPKIKSKAEKIEEETIPALNKTSENVSKYVMKKYSEAIEAKKNAEKERKQGKMKTVRNALIASSIGFTAGAATGYVLVKKSQIKESDYVFSDKENTENQNLNNTNINNNVANFNPPNTYKQQYDNVVNSKGAAKINSMLGSQNTSKNIANTYTISDDGKTIIRR